MDILASACLEALGSESTDSHGSRRKVHNTRKGEMAESPPQPAQLKKERKKGLAWTEEEHRRFLMGLEKLGRGDWRGIARHYVKTRTPTQVASHAQKHFIRLNSSNKRKKRASLFDITGVQEPTPAALAQKLEAHRERSSESCDRPTTVGATSVPSSGSGGSASRAVGTPLSPLHSQEPSRPSTPRSPVAKVAAQRDPPPTVPLGTDAEAPQDGPHAAVGAGVGQWWRLLPFEDAFPAGTVARQWPDTFAPWQPQAPKEETAPLHVGLAVHPAPSPAPARPPAPRVGNILRPTPMIAKPKPIRLTPACTGAHGLPLTMRLMGVVGDANAEDDQHTDEDDLVLPGGTVGALPHAHEAGAC